MKMKMKNEKYSSMNEDCSSVLQHYAGTVTLKQSTQQSGNPQVMHI